MHKLIITADDYGMCTDVNTAIEECVQAGTVLSVNMMSNMECAGDAADFRSRFPHVSLGIHFNFTTGRPIMPADKVPSLVDSEGNFITFAEIRRRWKNGKYSADEVMCEMHAQYDRFVEICGQPDYWNTHENVHVFPGMYRLFRDAGLKLGIYKMRSHQRIYLPSSDGCTDKSLKWRLTDPVKRLLLNVWQNQSRRRGVKAPDGIIVRLREADKNNLDYMFGNILWKRNAVAELIIHPSISGDCRYFGQVTEQRVREYLLFSDINVLITAAKYGVHIAGFDEV